MSLKPPPTGWAPTSYNILWGLRYPKLPVLKETRIVGDFHRFAMSKDSTCLDTDCKTWICLLDA